MRELPSNKVTLTKIDSLKEEGIFLTIFAFVHNTVELGTLILQVFVFYFPILLFAEWLNAFIFQLHFRDLTLVNLKVYFHIFYKRLNIPG